MKTALSSLVLFFIIGGIFPKSVQTQSADVSPPDQPVKLIFIHHSTGENWLSDEYGNLGRELSANNYFVSDTNYGWGPDGIGDRTDIINWREWFRGNQTHRYMEALYSENGQNANYTRMFADPGGENQVVMFKSCFPNSALAGSPNDPPTPNEDFTVGHAKFVYNDLLNYFSTRPDKLFIVITAPPLQDSTYADNARAFNNWLVHDWLTENNYAHNNVAVFDFFNVLTHPDNHHRLVGGQIEHIDNGVNTLYYDSDGDDHPNQAGSQKATEDFIPLLNDYYHRWLEGAPAVLPSPVEEPVPADGEQDSGETVAQPEDESSPPGSPPAGSPPSDLIDDFGGALPPGTDGWHPYWDASTTTTFDCAPQDGSLRIDFDIAADSWATCSLFFDALQNWSAYQGVIFSYQAGAPARVFDFTLHSGSLDESTSYQHAVESVPGSDSDWIPIDLTWNQILGVDWEVDANNPIDPARITGVSIGFSTYEGATNNGTIWINDLRLFTGQANIETDQTSPQSETAKPESEEPGSSGGETQTGESESQPKTETPSQGNGGLCPNTVGLGMLALAGVILKRKHAIS